MTIDDLGELSDGEFTLSNEDYDDYMVYIIKKAKCDGEKAVSSRNARDYVVMYKLEGAGVYCEGSK